MKKRVGKKLVLSKDTVKKLTDQEVRQVGGGAKTYSPHCITSLTKTPCCG